MAEQLDTQQKIHPQEAQIPSTFLDLAKLLLTMFGPQTFGVVLLITVWLIMVRPTLEHNALLDAQQRETIEDLKIMRMELRELLSHAKSTVELLDRTLIKAQP